MDSRIEMVRRTAMKPSRKDFEENEEFLTASGIAFVASLGAKTAKTVLPSDISAYMCNLNSVYQTSEVFSSFGLHHCLSKLQLYGASVPVGDDSTAGGISWSWMRQIHPSYLFFSSDFHQGNPPTTSRFDEAVQKLLTPLSSASFDFTLCKHPAYNDYGLILYLTKIILKSNASWNDDAPLLRMLLIGDSSIDRRTIKCDPLWSVICPDARIKEVERQKPSERPEDALCPKNVNITAVTTDTWIRLRNGIWHMSDCRIDEVAVIPVKASMLSSSAIFLYISSFITSRVWNSRYCWRVLAEPGPDSAATRDKEYDFWVRTRASQVVVEGPSRVLLVVTDITSHLMQQWISCYDFSIPIWSPRTQSEEPSIDLLPRIENWLDLVDPSNHVAECWYEAWRWMITYVATQDSVNHVLTLIAETSRVLHVGPLYNNTNETSPSFYSIGLKDAPPMVEKLTWTMRKWSEMGDDPTVVKGLISTWIEDIETPWLSPYHLRPSLYCRFSDRDKSDWMTKIRGSDQTVKCHEATPDMRLARFCGLIAEPTSPAFIGSTASVQESLSAIATLLSAGVMWMQCAIGVGWAKWVRNHRIRIERMLATVITKMVAEASRGCVSLCGPSDWWEKSIAKSLTGKQSSLDVICDTTNTTLCPWYWIKFVLQKVGYIIPEELTMRQRGVESLQTGPIATGWYADKSSQWQTVCRMTSGLGITSCDAPLVACNTCSSGAIVGSYMQLSTHRCQSVGAETFYLCNVAQFEHEKFLDVSCAVIPIANAMCKLIPAELLIVRTKACPGTSIADDQMVTEPFAWWDWLQKSKWKNEKVSRCIERNDRSGQRSVTCGQEELHETVEEFTSEP